jgi:hypothetical protein
MDGLANHFSLVHPGQFARRIIIDWSFLVREFRSWTKIELPVATLELHLLMNQ